MQPGNINLNFIKNAVVLFADDRRFRHQRFKNQLDSFNGKLAINRNIEISAHDNTHERNQTFDITVNKNDHR